MTLLLRKFLSQRNTDPCLWRCSLHKMLKIDSMLKKQGVCCSYLFIYFFLFQLIFIFTIFFGYGNKLMDLKQRQNKIN